LKKTLLTAAKLIFFLSLGIFFIWIFMRNLTPDEKKEIYDTFIHANYMWILLSLVVALLSHYSRTIRWMILLKAMGYKPRVKITFLAVMIGYFANLALPRLGEVTRCGVLARYDNIPMQKSIGSVVTERGLDLITLFLAFLLTFIIHLDKLNQFKELTIYKKAVERWDQIENPGYVYITAGILIIGFIYLLYRLRHKISHTNFYQKLSEIIKGFFEGMKSLIKIKNPFWFIFHSLFIWLMYLLMVWVVFFSLPETSHFGLDVALAVLVFGSLGIVVVQGGIGIYPWIVAEILAMFSIALTKGYAMGWLLWTGQTIMIIVAGIVSMIVLPLLKRKTHETT
jgi:hypothetical protein